MPIPFVYVQARGSYRELGRAVGEGARDAIHASVAFFRDNFSAMTQGRLSFAEAERLALVKAAIRHLPHVEADSFDGLLIEYAARQKAQAVVRGLRAVSDFEFEFQLALMNRKLNGRIETIFMMPKDTYTFLSSRIVKEIASLGGDVSPFVPPHVKAALLEKLKPRKKF